MKYLLKKLVPYVVMLLCVIVTVQVSLLWITQSKPRVNNTMEWMPEKQTILTRVTTPLTGDPTKVLLQDRLAKEMDHILHVHSYTRVLGNLRKDKGFLTIGIPSVKRNNLDNPWGYLFDTLQSIINSTSDLDKKDVTVVIFLADFDEKYKEMKANALYQRFKEYFDTGFLVGIQADKEYYPSLKKLKRNYNDAPDRVYWRSKNNVDFSFLYSFSSNISKYYLTIEDDVECANNFVDAIRSYVQEQNVKSPSWIRLDFSGFGSIGKLFRSADILRISYYLMLFYQEQPVDFLFSHFQHLTVQTKKYLRVPTIFQHKGFVSSLEGKVMSKYIDKLYSKDIARKPKLL